jgi:regulator of G-protein signaling
LVKTRFFGFVGQGKKKVSSSTIPIPGGILQQQYQHQRRRGSDRSLSGSAHELAVCGVRDTVMTPQVPHSHSQSNLTDIPYR